ncbi:DUF3592 domain-containing protein [Kosakonia cowanii]|uniref:DUF3592 domain-containing protein n=1 Tax=Kosakonia cowanii TaxID=208223 RepID=UPI0028AB111F|nr:DUF3592 domain-containing protein [Kosakonia cowanii]
MKIAIAFSILFIVGMIAYIVYLFNRDHRIQSQGRDLQATIEEVSYISSNDNGTQNIRYRLAIHDGSVTRSVEGKETIAAFNSPKMQKGQKVDIKYLDDQHILFIFDKQESSANPG